jgi:DNA-binding LytR/AlgR family response regulator
MDLLHVLAGLKLCNELCPDAVFFDINLSDQAGVLLATRLAASKSRTGSQTLAVPVSQSRRKVAAPF